MSPVPPAVACPSSCPLSPQLSPVPVILLLLCRQCPCTFAILLHVLRVLHPTLIVLAAMKSRSVLPGDMLVPAPCPSSPLHHRNLHLQQLKKVKQTQRSLPADLQICWYSSNTEQTAVSQICHGDTPAANRFSPVE